VDGGSGATFPLDSNTRRPEGWTSADAAGLAILPGLIRYDEVYGIDPIRHAFRVTVRHSNGYVYPGSHRAGSTNGALPMGARLRLKASKDIPVSRAAAPHFPGDEDLRPDRGRQRSDLYVNRNVRHALGQRHPQSGIRRDQGERFRSGGVGVAVSTGGEGAGAGGAALKRIVAT